jgi:hypothetical protein
VGVLWLLKSVDFDAFFDFFHIVAEFFIGFDQVIHCLTSMNHG